MTKKEIKAALAYFKYKIIKPSWHHDKDKKVVIFNAYDECGMCHTFYVNYKTPYACRTMMTDSGAKLESCDVSFMFWEVAI